MTDMGGWDGIKKYKMKLIKNIGNCFIYIIWVIVLILASCYLKIHAFINKHKHKF